MNTPECHLDSVTRQVRFREQWSSSSEAFSGKPFSSTWMMSLSSATEWTKAWIGFFQRFQSYGLKLKPSKCHLLQEEVLFLGHIVSGKGVGPNPALVKDVQQWNPPNNLQELQAFLGLCNYYRKFVPRFAELASPLHNLLKKGTVFLWTVKHQAAFTKLKEKLTTAPVLGYPRAEGKFILDNNSVRAVLLQVQRGEE